MENKTLEELAIMLIELSKTVSAIIETQQIIITFLEKLNDRITDLEN